jgi:hypothetical protein
MQLAAWGMGDQGFGIPYPAQSMSLQTERHQTALPPVRSTVPPILVSSIPRTFSRGAARPPTEYISRALPVVGAVGGWGGGEGIEAEGGRGELERAGGRGAADCSLTIDPD